jgi:hypothetical protein
VAQIVEHLPSNLEALNSNSNTDKIKGIKNNCIMEASISYLALRRIST